MSNSTTSKYMTIIVISTFLFIIFTTGCSSVVPVSHDVLRRISNPKSGNILVKSFIDNREDADQKVGNLRDLYGFPTHSYMIAEEPSLETLMTEYFAEALERAGYKTVLESEQDTGTMPTSSFDTVLEGEIKQLWIDGYYYSYGCTIEVVLRALDSNSQNTIWEKEFAAEVDGVEISPALTDILNQAAQTFASDEFYRNVVKAGN